MSQHTDTDTEHTHRLVTDRQTNEPSINITPYPGTQTSCYITAPVSPSEMLVVAAVLMPGREQTTPQTHLVTD